MIILPMAGLSRRFTDAGYDKPKYELEIAGRPVFDWALLSFARYFGTHRVVIVHRALPGIVDFLRARATACGCGDAILVSLPSPTQGQAETVSAALEALEPAPEEPLTIFNIDTFRPGLRIADGEDIAGGGGYLEAFVGEGSHWSFVEPDASTSSRVRRVVEKVRISDYCCTGLYHFTNAGAFRQAYAQELRHRSSSELFVAPLYQHLIDGGAKIYYTLIEPGKIFFCGTPSEYEDLKGRQSEIISAFSNPG